MSLPKGKHGIERIVKGDKMRITKAVLDQAKEGMLVIRRTNHNCYIYTSRDEPRRIEWMVERGNSYYCGQKEDAFVYWDYGVYGFDFDGSLFDENE
jgi:hypothetical protein